MAGGAKSLASPEHEADREFLLAQVEKSIRLHGTDRVILMLHSDCGAYGGLHKIFGDLRPRRSLIIAANSGARTRCCKGRFRCFRSNATLSISRESGNWIPSPCHTPRLQDQPGPDQARHLMPCSRISRTATGAGPATESARKGGLHSKTSCASVLYLWTSSSSVRFPYAWCTKCRFDTMNHPQSDGNHVAPTGRAMARRKAQ